jgi:hypothetical protein
VPPQQPQQPHPKEQPPQLQLLEAKRGITVIKDAASMQRLVATLAAAPSWGFSLHLDDPPPAKGRNKKRNSTGNESAADIAAEAAAAGKEAAAVAAASTSTRWRWGVLGVSFSAADGCAWYVPLYVGRGARADMAVRHGTSPWVVQQMWAGLQAIFAGSGDGAGGGDTSSSSSSTPGTYIHSRVLQVAEAARAADAATAAVAASSAVKPDSVDDSNAAAAAAAATAAQAAAACGPGSWLSPPPVRVTFALKTLLKLLYDPPAASGLPGLQLLGPVVDVRVAAWVLSPETPGVVEPVEGAHPSCKRVLSGSQCCWQRWPAFECGWGC